jgi:transcriptional regulator with XRE-family HTH domain
MAHALVVDYARRSAMRTRVSRSAVSRWCSGERDPNPGQLRSICLLLAIDPALLLGL